MFFLMQHPVITLSGSVEPVHEHWILSEISARVESLYVRDGVMVQPNDPLVRLHVPMAELEVLDALTLTAALGREVELNRRRHIQDSIDQIRRLELAESQLDEAQARLAEVLVDYRFDSMRQAAIDSGGGTRVRQARALVDRSAAEVRHARSGLFQSTSMDSLFRVSLESAADRLRVAQHRSADLLIKAPRAGMVVWSPALLGVGVQVAAGERLGRILDTSCWTVRAIVPDERIGRVNVGDSAKIRLLAHPDSTPVPGFVAEVHVRELQEQGGGRLAHEAILRVACPDVPLRQRYWAPGLAAEALFAGSSKWRWPRLLDR